MIQGFTQGFDIGYRGPLDRTDQADNLPFRIGTKLDLWNKVMKEVEAGHYAGPFKKLPGKYFIQ